MGDKTYENTEMEISKLMSDLKHNDININRVYNIDNPDDEDKGYQRNFMWPKATQYNLIESVLNNEPIPAILLWKTSKMNTSNTKYIKEVIDGQQRLMTLLSFYKNELTIPKNILDKKGMTIFFPPNLKEASFSDLHSKYIANFNDYKISTIIMYYREKDVALKVFINMNTNGKKLNNHEIREANASNSDNNNNNVFISLTNDLSSLLTSNFKSFKPNSKAREFVFKFFDFALTSPLKFKDTGKGYLDTRYEHEFTHNTFDGFKPQIKEFLSCMITLKDMNIMTKWYSEMYYPVFYRIWNEDPDNYISYITQFYRLIIKKQHDGTWLYEEYINKITMNSSIQKAQKTICYNEIKRFMKNNQ